MRPPVPNPAVPPPPAWCCLSTQPPSANPHLGKELDAVGLSLRRVVAAALQPPAKGHIEWHA
eukprot:365459-Chlamydomonas_euryale.AAC.12